jgi:hypothetical protein
MTFASPDDDFDDAFGESAHTGLPDSARRVLADLLTRRFVVRGSQADDVWWATLIAYRTELEAHLADLYFDLFVDEDARVAFKRRVDGEEAPRRLLKPERPLSRDASLLLIFLRQECAYSDGQDGPTTVTRTELEEFLRAYRHEDNGNEVRFANRATTAIGQLTELKLLQQDRDADYLYTISPALPALVGIDEIARLDALYRQGADAAEHELATPTDEADAEDLPRNEQEGKEDEW